MRMVVQSVKTVDKVEAVREIVCYKIEKDGSLTHIYQTPEFHEAMKRHVRELYPNSELMDAKGEGLYSRLKNQPHFEYSSISKEKLDNWVKELLDCKPTAKSRLRMFSLRRKHFWKRVNRRKNGYRRCN